MRLAFLNRSEELARLSRLLDRREGSVAVIYGHRRLGKSRLLREALARRRHVYYVGDERDGVLQRTSVATEVGRLIQGFDRVSYPDWAALFDRLWGHPDAPAVLALDEFPALVAAAPELPSILQKRVDAGGAVHLVLAGSSQRMMQGLILDRSAPLFGRASEILKIRPLAAGWIASALRLTDTRAVVEAYALWGGVPRYWELAAEYPDTTAALRALVLNPLGVLHEEPAGLLLDDMRDTAQATSILSLIGRGCHRLSEIAGRLEKPATSLTRPLRRLVDLELVRRDIPFDTPERTGKRSLYRIADPFLRFWFGFVEPHRSLLESRRLAPVERFIARSFPAHVAGVWEDLARESVPVLRCHGRDWKPAARWWGPGTDRKPLEIDIVAESIEGSALLVGEVKWGEEDAERLLSELRRKAERLPITRDREVLFALWLAKRPSRRSVPVYSPDQVMRGLR
jgi:uncharacterized protein